MYFKPNQLASVAITAVLAPQQARSQNASTGERFNITAIASRDGYSVLECWQLAATGTYAHSAMNWIVGTDTTQGELSIIEPRTTPGQAWAPAVQFTVVLDGLIRITTPNAPAPLNGSAAYMMSGTRSASVLIAADLNTTSYRAGHYTEFPSESETVLFQLPFVDNAVPEHSVLYDGPCET